MNEGNVATEGEKKKVHTRPNYITDGTELQLNF
jgi:hypothetical protein